MSSRHSTWVTYLADSNAAAAEGAAAQIADSIQRSTRDTTHAISQATDASNRELRHQGFETREAITESTKQQLAAQADTRHAVVGAISGLGNRVDGLTDAMRAGAEVLSSNLAALAGVTQSGFELVAQRMSAQAVMLSDIATMTANPVSTAAAEYYRRGIDALHNGWFEEAAVELQQAVEKHPTNPAPQYALGVARAALGQPELAFGPLGRAVRYATADQAWARLAATAALLQRSIATSEQSEEVGRLLDSALVGAPDCAELYLARAAHRGRRDDLVRALNLAPELALVAIRAGMPGAEDVADEVYADPEGPVQARLEIQRLVAESGDAGFGDNPIPEDVPEAMVTFATWVDTHSARIVEHAEKGLTRKIEAAHAARSVAEAGVKRAENDVGNAERLITQLERHRREWTKLLAQFESQRVAVAPVAVVAPVSDAPAGLFARLTRSRRPDAAPTPTEPTAADHAATAEALEGKIAERRARLRRLDDQIAAAHHELTERQEGVVLAQERVVDAGLQAERVRAHGASFYTPIPRLAKRLSITRVRPLEGSGN